MENETEEKMKKEVKETTKKPATKKTTTKKTTTQSKKTTGTKTTTAKKPATKKATTAKATTAKKATSTAKKTNTAKTVKTASEEVKEVAKKVEVKEPEKKEEKNIKTKKKHRGLKIFGILLIIIIAIYMALVIRNFFILNTYGVAMKMYGQSNNYFIKRTEDDTKSPMVNTITYYKDGVIKNHIDVTNMQRNMVAYQNPNTDERIIRINSEGNKVAVVSRVQGGLVPSGQIYNIFGAMTERDNLLLSLMTRITTERCNGKDCYKINMQGMEVWIDKETYLVVRLINGQYKDDQGIEHDMATNYEYGFGTVTPEQVSRPDLTGCKIQVQD